jgi:hypothetical protein
MTEIETGRMTPAEKDLIRRAEELAMQHHDGIQRKFSGDPYFTHPRRVAIRVSALQGATATMIAAAFLHDFLEDADRSGSKGTPGAILALYCDNPGFAKAVVFLVEELTNKSKIITGLNREGRKKMDCERLSKVSSEAKRIKMIDRIDNLMETPAGDFLTKYLEESRMLAEAVGDADHSLKAELLATIERAARMNAEREDETKVRTGYMCGIAWQYELGEKHRDKAVEVYSLPEFCAEKKEMRRRMRHRGGRDPVQEMGQGTELPRQKANAGSRDGSRNRTPQAKSKCR